MIYVSPKTTIIYSYPISAIFFFFGKHNQQSNGCTKKCDFCTKRYIKCVLKKTCMSVFFRPLN